jgi:hypothetical protein
LAAASFSASTRAITLCVCEWLRHNWFAGAIGASEPQSIRVSIAWAYRLSSVLLAASKNVQPSKHDFWSRYRAGATTLIISLGIISKPRELVIIEVAVFLLVAQALMINRLAGLPYPLWNVGASIKPVNEDSE